MGADLYIMQLHQPLVEQWEPELEEAATFRDRLKEGTPERDAAQAKVEECYGKMYEQGYFRDSYNDWNLLWKFGLSWWQDVIPMLDDQDRLSGAQILRLRAMLRDREPVFDEALTGLPRRDRKYFRERYAELRGFLDQAIGLNAPIEASL